MNNLFENEINRLVDVILEWGRPEKNRRGLFVYDYPLTFFPPSAFLQGIDFSYMKDLRPSFRGETGFAFTLPSGVVKTSVLIDEWAGSYRRLRAVFREPVDYEDILKIAPIFSALALAIRAAGAYEFPRGLAGVVIVLHFAKIRARNRDIPRRLKAVDWFEFLQDGKIVLSIIHAMKKAARNG